MFFKSGVIAVDQSVVDKQRQTCSYIVYKSSSSDDTVGRPENKICGGPKSASR